MIQDKTAVPISRNRKEIFGLTYVPDRLQAAHEQSLASSSSETDESNLFNAYMKDMKVKRVSKASRTKAVSR